MKTASVRLSANAQLYTLNSQIIVRLSEDNSLKMPSRGQVAVTGTINNHEFKTVIEPDGYWGHFIKISDEMKNNMGIKAGDIVKLNISVTREWPEPVVPNDFAIGLAKAPQKVREKWNDITPMARWEWIRWVNATNNLDTRAIRIDKSVSKLNGNHRRPCCFNLASCTDPGLSKGGRLMKVA
ncbi:MAG: YdeI/OmpD-associated family protein [Candidatus Saccharimonadales bacterium]